MSAASYRFGRFVVDRVAYRVVQESGEPLALTPKLLDLLLFLLDHAGELVTKEALLDGVWPGANVTENALAQAMSDLRQALGDQRETPQFIKTVARRGYRFIGRVEPNAPARARDWTEPAAPAAKGAGRTIAVLDFTNLSGDADVAWLSAGIAETVTGDLRSLGDFRVLDRRRVVESARRTDGSLAAVTADLGAQLAVVGSFQRSGSNIRITARLVDVVDGEAVADAKVDGPIETIFDLQDRIVLGFAQAMGVTVHRSGGSRIGAPETASLEAYRAATEGWLRLETLDVGELERAVEDFSRAVALDHRYALAHTGLANAEFALYETTRSDNEPSDLLLERANEHARHAVALDEGLAEAHATLAMILVSASRFEEAGVEARRAVALEPFNWRHRFRLGHASWGDARLKAGEATLAQYPAFAFAYFQMAMVHVARGHLSEADSILRRGIATQERQRDHRERFPALGLHWLLGLTCLARDDVDAAIREFGRELALAEPHRLYGREYTMYAHYCRALAFLQTHRAAEAIGCLEQALALYPDHAPSHLALGLAYRQVGSTTRERDAFARAEAASATLVRSRPTEAAIVRAMQLAAQDQANESAETLARLLDNAPPGFAGWTIPVEPLLRPLVSHPQFRAVLEKLSQRAR